MSPSGRWSTRTTRRRGKQNAEAFGEEVRARCPDVDLLRSCVVANLRLNETAYLQVEQKLLGDDALERLGWIGLLDSELLVRAWPHVKPMVSTEFAASLEVKQPRLQGF